MIRGLYYFLFIFFYCFSALYSQQLYAHINTTVKVVNLGNVEEIVTASNRKNISVKAMAFDDTGNMPIKFYGELTKLVQNNKVFKLTHLLLSSYNHERVLKTTERTTVVLCEEEERNIVISEEVLSSFSTTIKATKIAEYNNQNLQKKYLCSLCKSMLVPDEDDIVECQCGYMASKEAALTNTTMKVTILDSNNLKVVVNVSIEQIESCYNSDNKLTKKEKERKIIKSKVDVTYDKEAMEVNSLTLAEK